MTISTIAVVITRHPRHCALDSIACIDCKWWGAFAGVIARYCCLHTQHPNSKSISRSAPATTVRHISSSHSNGKCETRKRKKKKRTELSFNHFDIRHNGIQYSIELTTSKINRQPINCLSLKHTHIHTPLGSLPLPKDLYSRY